jgi:hypothetical protein
LREACERSAGFSASSRERFQLSCQRGQCVPASERRQPAHPLQLALQTVLLLEPCQYSA